MEKEVVEEIKKQKKKEKEDKRAKHVINYLTIVEKTIQRLVDKCVRTTSNLVESTTIF